MARWSHDEVNRTIDEVKRRSLVNPDFRVLALTQPLAAIAKINPKPFPEGLSVEFIDDSDTTHTPVSSGRDLIIVLPKPVAKADELSDAELEQAAGGLTDVKFPIE
jgi:hypothetical protein